MGSLHEGHLALVRQGLGRGLPVVVSIFVNPTQFSANEDFGTYPRSLESDARAATEAGATAIYAPPAEEIYPDGPEAAVAAAAAFPVPEVGRTPRLEDGFRPHFFGGVCLVVSRLFDLVDPSCAIFGEKDWQQLQVIRAMVDQQHRTRPIEIESAPIVRDPDGLAMSSRNAYLSDDQRLMGLGLHRALAANITASA